MIAESGQYTIKDYTCTKFVQKQFTSDAEAAMVASAAESGSTAMGAFALFNTVLFSVTNVGSGAMQSMFSTMRSLQLTVVIILFKVQLTPQLEMVYQQLAAVVMFDFLETIENIFDKKYRLLNYTP